MRLADEIVDSFHAYNKEVLLASLRKETVASIDMEISLNPIINSFQHTVREYAIEWDLIDNFLESMEYDLHNKSCTDKSYKTYIRGSAEAVGLMCLHVFTGQNKGQYETLKPYAESLGSAFQKINFLRDLADDYNSLNRVYFPNIDMNNFRDVDKQSIENDIAKDFKHALIGIHLLNKESRKGVFLAYKYYISLFNKIKEPQTSTIMKKGEKFFEEQMEILPNLYKALLGEDEDGLIWMPQTVNLPQNGMVFATAAKEFGVKGEAVSQDNYEWAGVKAVKITEEEKEKFPIPGKKGEFYEWRMDMTTEKRFAHNDFVEALDDIGVFGSDDE